LLAFLDSGIGGLTVARSLQALRPDADILYLADRVNAPYGTKSEAALLSVLERAIRALLARGADCVVLACITASCLYDRLSYDISPRVIPILPFMAKEIAKQREAIEAQLREKILAEMSQVKTEETTEDAAKI